MLNYHAASDTFDKVDIAELKKHVGILGRDGVRAG